MTSTLTFSLPEDQHDFLLAAQAGELATVIVESLNLIRSHFKHGDTENIEATTQCLKDVQESLLEVVHIVCP